LLSDGKHLICVYANGTVSLWNLKESTNRSVNLGSPCTTLDLHPNLPLAAIGTDAGFVALINTTNVEIISNLNAVQKVAYSDF
jgi:WD40 repeat protein